MTSGDFEHRNEARWAEYERLINLMEKGKAGVEAEHLPRLTERCWRGGLRRFRSAFRPPPAGSTCCAALARGNCWNLAVAGSKRAT